MRESLRKASSRHGRDQGANALRFMKCTEIWQKWQMFLGQPVDSPNNVLQGVIIQAVHIVAGYAENARHAPR